MTGVYQTIKKQNTQFISEYHVEKQLFQVQ